ncbi:MAG: DNA polymerase III subunit epsilon [Kordiimonas sp.]|nr:DNA polymerase III subunit epsilon [Kordiimonas sp.]
MREIVFDTETTGLDPNDGHKLVEIGCVEVINHIPTGKTYHQYINPERDMPAEAFAVHGLSAEFLQDYPTFAEVVSDFIDFVGDAKLVAHNAEFDMRFINAEMKKLGFKPYSAMRAIDTLAISRRKFPGASHTLDALCRRYEIDNSNRVLHGALLDAQLLAEVYLELMGGRQAGLELTEQQKKAGVIQRERPYREARPHQASADELAAHQNFITTEINDAVWLRLARGAVNEETSIETELPKDR